MNPPPPGQITELLIQARGGDAGAHARLIQTIYDELRKIAGRYMRDERPDHTLQPTALVHEAWVKLKNEGALEDATNRAYLFHAAARAMRQILVDHSRAKQAEKRGGDHGREPWGDWVAAIEEKEGVDFSALDEALSRLERLNARHAKIVELHFFGGLTHKQIAEQLDLGVSTVEGDWAAARAVLHSSLKRK